MKIKLIPEGLIVDAYPVLSRPESLLIKYSDPAIIKQKERRWDFRSQGTYEIIEVEPYEQKFINRH